MDVEKARKLVTEHLDKLNPDLRELNKAIHSHPELGYQEKFAHGSLAALLEKQGFQVSRHAHGLETSFEASIGTGGRQVVFCAEYDALPEIGHACGHNLIATSSMAAFLAAANALSVLGIPGRLRILGTPAEEGGAGKVKLIDAGAFDPPEDIAAAIMAHPVAAHQIGVQDSDCSAVAGIRLIASHKFHVEFRGKSAHAGGAPWDGRNALDAAVMAYASVGLMRQQIRPEERIHAVVEVGGTVANVIPSYTRMSWNVRSPTVKSADALLDRVKACLEAAASASGCEINYIWTPMYKDLRVNRTLCEAFAEDMSKIGEQVRVDQSEPFNASTDMGNVSYHVPSFHGGFAIPTLPEAPHAASHVPEFTNATGTDDAHAAAIRCANGMAMLALRVLTDDSLAKGARDDFDKRDGEGR